MKNDEITRFIVFFGLDEDFNQEQLQRSYRTLAKLYHPDVRNTDDSVKTMSLINEGYDLLSNYTVTRKQELPGEDLSRRHVPVDDEYYRQYKNGFRIMQKAFDDYFGEGDKKFEGKLDILQHRLRSAKEAFASLVYDMGYSQWVSDAIDKIYSINKWIK